MIIFKKKIKKLTGNSEIIEGHVMEVWIDIAFLEPPSNFIGDMLRVIGEITIQFVVKI